MGQSELFGCGSRKWLADDAPAEPLMDLNEQQQAVKDALIEQQADEVVAGVTEDQRAVAIEVGDAGAYFSPHEVSELNKAVVRGIGKGSLPEQMKGIISHLNDLARVVSGEIDESEAIGRMPSDVTVSFPDGDG